MGNFSGKTVLITGGTSGIGLATAKAFLQQGAKVVVTGRDEKGLQAARLELGANAIAVRSDAGNLKDLGPLAEVVKEKLGGKLDVLFVNAGIARFVPFASASEELWDETFNINAKGAFFTVQKLLPFLKPGSAVVFNTSVVDGKGYPTASVYAASKAALRSVTRTLAAELIGQGIRVNAVSPGPIDTPIYTKLGLTKEQSDGFAEQMKALNPSKRFGTPEEVAHAVLFLASPEASYTIGVDFAVDGGVADLS